MVVATDDGAAYEKRHGYFLHWSTTTHTDVGDTTNFLSDHISGTSSIDPSTYHAPYVNRITWSLKATCDCLLLIWCHIVKQSRMKHCNFLILFCEHPKVMLQYQISKWGAPMFYNFFMPRLLSSKLDVIVHFDRRELPTFTAFVILQRGVGIYSSGGPCSPLPRLLIGSGCKFVTFLHSLMIFLDLIWSFFISFAAKFRRKFIQHIKHPHKPIMRPGENIEQLKTPWRHDAAFSCCTAQIWTSPTISLSMCRPVGMWRPFFDRFSTKPNIFISFKIDACTIDPRFSAQIRVCYWAPPRKRVYNTHHFSFPPFEPIPPILPTPLCLSFPSQRHQTAKWWEPTCIELKVIAYDCMTPQ